MNPKLSASVSVVSLGKGQIEFFKTNTRQSVVICCNDERILEVLDAFNGIESLKEISIRLGIKQESLDNLASFLRKRGILDNVVDVTLFKEYYKFRRVISFLNDFSTSSENLLEMWNNIRSSTVLIVGLGAVGSWVAINLVQSGVRNFILIDPDKVEVTNLHRQFGYGEKDIGRYKVDVIADRLRMFENGVNVIQYKTFLEESTLDSLGVSNVDLVINCADKPNVDTTSRWIGRFCLEKDIPHIVGGGYNLHTSLIGQTIMPNQGACVRCFEKELADENDIDFSKVKKLARPNRKIGSFGPMCALVASMTGIEALKVLTKSIVPANINRRGQFDVMTMQLEYKTYKRRLDCEWCGGDAKN